MNQLKIKLLNTSDEIKSKIIQITYYMYKENCLMVQRVMIQMDKTEKIQVKE